MSAIGKQIEAKLLRSVMRAYGEQVRFESLASADEHVTKSLQCLEESYQLLRRVDRELAKFDMR